MPRSVNARTIRRQNCVARSDKARQAARQNPTKPVKALIMSEDYELGSYSRSAQILRVDEMYDGLPIKRYTR